MRNWPFTRWSRLSQVIGGMLLGIFVFWLARFLFFSAPTSPQVLPFDGASAPPAATTISTPAALKDAGITLESSAAPATMSQAQALQLAQQFEPDAASGAKKTVAQAVLLTYPASAAIKGHADYQRVPVWMVWYQQIPQGQNDVAIDNQSAHDLYVFLDARAGQEVLTVWS